MGEGHEAGAGRVGGVLDAKVKLPEVGGVMIGGVAGLVVEGSVGTEKNRWVLGEGGKGRGVSGWWLCGRRLVAGKLVGWKCGTWETGYHLYGNVDGCGPCVNGVALAVADWNRHRIVDDLLLEEMDSGAQASQVMGSGRWRWLG